MVMTESCAVVLFIWLVETQFFCANYRAIEYVTTITHLFVFNGGLQEPTGCLLGGHLLSE